MDKFDKAILNIMQNDPALSVAQIAEKVALSKTACWRRIQNLEANSVIRERAVLLNPESVNLPLSCFIVVRTNQHNDKWFRKFRQITESIPEILEVYRMSGDLDYLIKAAVTDMPGYDRLYQQLIKADLFDVSASFVMETMKKTTRLPLDHVAIG